LKLYRTGPARYAAFGAYKGRKIRAISHTITSSGTAKTANNAARMQRRNT